MLFAISLIGTVVFAWLGPIGFYYVTQIQFTNAEYDGVRIACTALMVVFGCGLMTALDKPQSRFD